jgi:hypothetical protein
VALAKSQGGFVILITFVVALTLMMMPLPEWAEAARPQWLIMAVIYWCIALPDRVGVIIAWMIGLVLDVATGSLLGQNALAFGIVAFLAIKLHLPCGSKDSPANRHKAGLTGWRLSPACCYGHLYSPYYAECGVFTVSDSLKILNNIELNLCLQL